MSYKIICKVHDFLTISIFCIVANVDRRPIVLCACLRQQIFFAQIIFRSCCDFLRLWLYRLREFDYRANLNTSIIPCMAGEYKTGEYFNINFNSISSLDYVTKESCEICARRSNVQLQAMIENVHMLYLAGTKYVSIFYVSALKYTRRLFLT
jgi:hypothetical protein